MTDEPQPSATPSGRPKPGGSRGYIIDRLRRTGFNELADQVVAREVSARHAALLMGFGDTRSRLRKDEVAVPRKVYERLRAAALEREHDERKKIDVRALIG